MTESARYFNALAARLQGELERLHWEVPGISHDERERIKDEAHDAIRRAKRDAMRDAARERSEVGA